MSGDREEFEAWAKTQANTWLEVRGLDWGYVTDDYASPRTNAAWLAWQAASATPADHSRDSVIEECAAVCHEAENGFKTMDRKQTASYLAAMIRALKSQQDAAIESKPVEQSRDSAERKDKVLRRMLNKGIEGPDVIGPRFVIGMGYINESASKAQEPAGYFLYDQQAETWQQVAPEHEHDADVIPLFRAATQLSGNGESS